ncbi:MAG: hydantoinase/oxoprolinase family protein [Deltaproteobacteria bacterium]|nr:hydantoinase/oxoprolinase family protein [Deltaproteobacteria bacterium]
MNEVYVGIDVGGTHTDGVAVLESRIAHKVKVPTTDDLAACTLEALEQLLDEIPPSYVSRVVLSTTLVTNAVVEEKLEKTGLVVTAGPGMNPASLLVDGDCRVAGGAIDHRGREIAPLDNEGVAGHLERMAGSGVRVLAAVGKFSVRNPAHELRIGELAGGRFDYVALGHTLSGLLNFPRRVATAYLSAGVWRRYARFIEAIGEALTSFGIHAPLYILRADGGTQLAASVRNPAETALSGPAASIMGAAALDDMGADSFAFDIGGTTTDISLFTGGVPLLEAKGAKIGRFRTQIRSLYTRSTGAGGDSLVSLEGDALKVGPRRLGPPASLGGAHPTPTDALVLLGRALGDREKAALVLTPIAESLGLMVEETARRVLKALAGVIAKAAVAYLAEVNAKPVYTIHELLADRQIRPRRAVAVGGPARALAPYVEEALDLPVHVPEHFDVANAIGAALSRVNLEVNLLADTAGGTLSIPEAGIFRSIPRSYSLAQAKEEAAEALRTVARGKGLLDPEAVVEIAEEESFRVVEGSTHAGNIHRLRLQIRPGLLRRLT